MPEDRLQEVCGCEETGTRITFYPDPEIFETLDFNYSTIRHRVRELAYLNKGLKLTITDKREAEPRREEFMYEGGIIHFVDKLNAMHATVFPTPIYFHEFTENGEVEIAMQYNDTYSEVIYAYANNINTEEGGTHLEGFKSALTRKIGRAHV